MSVKVRPYGNGGWEADIRMRLPDGTVIRERVKNPVTGKSAVQRWATERERILFRDGKPTRQRKEAIDTTSVPTLADFAPRFLSGYAKANRHKPSGIAGKESIIRVHLFPRFGDRPLDRISTEDVQRLKAALGDRAPKTVNNVLTVLNVILKTAVEWGVIERMSCRVTLQRTSAAEARFLDFDEYERLVQQAEADGPVTHAAVLLAGEAGLRCGELMALEWRDVDLDKRQLTVARSEWKGHVTAPKSGRLRRVPMTERLALALRDARHLRGPRVVSDDQGRPLTQKVVQILARHAARRAQVRAGVHILRHTFCSHLAMRGAPARAIQELAGHQDLMTTQRYMHLSPAALEAAIRLLDRPGMSPVRGEILEAAGKQGWF
jgi:integrase